MTTDLKIDWRALKRPDVLWVTGFGLGVLRPAPGTWGSIGALAFWWFFLAPLAWSWQLGIVLAYFALSTYLCERVCRQLKIPDAPEIVADEVAGMWLALIALPPHWGWLLAAFVLFRLLDITKPGPIGWLDRHVKGGLGVMIDDVFAGLVVAGGLHLVLYFVL